MAKIVGCSPSSITNEILKYRIFKDYSFGTFKRKCFDERLIRDPYVCNGCKNLSSCKKSKYFYDPDTAHRKYRETLSNSRSHIHPNSEALKYIDNLVSPLILDNKETIDHTLLPNEVDTLRSTLYRYISLGLLEAKNVDLKRRVKYKIRTKKKETKVINVNKKGRKYLDFLAFKANHPNMRIAEPDTVIGKRDEGECLFTIIFRK